MKSADYLIKLQEITELNDTDLAEVLDLTQGAISHYKTGRRIMDDETCLAIAIALDVPPMEIIGAAMNDRAAKAGKKSNWQVFTERMAATASAILVVNLFLTPTPAKAAPVLKDAVQQLYIMSNRRRRLRAMVAAIKRMFSAPTLQPTTR